MLDFVHRLYRRLRPLPADEWPMIELRHNEDGSVTTVRRRPDGRQFVAELHRQVP